MQFGTLSFSLFYATVVALYWGLGAERRGAQKWLLLGASYVFYASFAWQFAALLLLSTGVNFAIGRWIGAARSAPALAPLRVGLAFNLLLLGVYKYYGFFRDNLEDLLLLLGLEPHLPILTLVLPIGISFYTFQAIAYLVDVHRGQGPQARSLLDFALFLAFFPQLLIGPICRGRDLLPQIEGPAPRSVEQFSTGVTLILSGLFKRAVLATLLYEQGVSSAFDHPEGHSAAALWVGAVGYTIYLYADFSGYTDMARGFGAMLGFRIPENFRGPYAATTIGEFWRRWHITFSQWLRDFIYFPLGGSRKGQLRTYFNLFATLFVCGLWHGATWGFLIWGSIHGVALVLYKATLDYKRARGLPLRQSPPMAFVGWWWTFSVCVLSRIFFYAPDFQGALTYFARLVDFQAPGDGFAPLMLPLIGLGLWMNFHGTAFRTRFVGIAERLPLVARLLFWAIALLAIAWLRPDGVAPNVYFRF